jgi:hypothetical protein
MGANFDALNAENKIAVEWKAKQNLAMALADGNQNALSNQRLFLENNQESLATNEEGLKHILKEYRENLSTILDD